MRLSNRRPNRLLGIILGFIWSYSAKSVIKNRVYNKLTARPLREPQDFAVYQREQQMAL